VAHEAEHIIAAGYPPYSTNKAYQLKWRTQAQLTRKRTNFTMLLSTGSWKSSSSPSNPGPSPRSGLLFLLTRVLMQHKTVVMHLKARIKEKRAGVARSALARAADVMHAYVLDIPACSISTMIYTDLGNCTRWWSASHLGLPMHAASPSRQIERAASKHEALLYF